MIIRITLSCLAALFALVVSAAAQSDEDALSVTNGDFSDLTGLQQMADGWYAGVPAGWTALESGEFPPNYSIRHQVGDFVANVAALGRTQPSFAAFEQEIGQLPVPGEVTVAFELKEPWHDPAFFMGAAIYDCLTVIPLAVGEYSNAGTHTLVASNVSAGTRIKIGFWAANGFPALDNVVVTFKPNE